MNRPKNILTLAFLFAFIGAMCAWAVETTDPSEDTQEVEIIIGEQNTVRIVGAKGETVYIYNIAGLTEDTFRLNSDDETRRLNLRRGGYIIKVGKLLTRKIAITR